MSESIKSSFNREYSTEEKNLFSKIDTSFFKKNLKEWSKWKDVEELNKFLLLETGMFKKSSLKAIDEFDSKTATMLWNYLKFKKWTWSLVIAWKQTFKFIKQDLKKYAESKTKIVKNNYNSAKAWKNYKVSEEKYKKNNYDSVKVWKKLKSAKVKNTENIKTELWHLDQNFWEVEKIHKETHAEIQNVWRWIKISTELDQDKKNGKSKKVWVKATETEVWVSASISESKNYKLDLSVISKIDNISSKDVYAEASLKMLYASQKLWSKCHNSVFIFSVFFTFADLSFFQTFTES